MRRKVAPIAVVNMLTGLMFVRCLCLVWKTYGCICRSVLFSAATTICLKVVGNDLLGMLGANIYIYICASVYIQICIHL